MIMARKTIPPIPTDEQEPVITVPVAYPVQVIEGLSVDDLMKDLTDADGLVTVKVLVSHDSFYAGSTVRLPPSERLVSMIINDWVEV
jgi:hypothetical protein